MKCETCRWWHKVKMPSGEATPWGQCRRKPPAWITEQNCAFPVTGPNEYCGEHEKAPADSATAAA